MHCIALHCIALHCITLHCVASHHIVLHYIALHYIALRYITSHHITLYYIAFDFIVVHCSTHYITVHDITNDAHQLPSRGDEHTRTRALSRPPPPVCRTASGGGEHAPRARKRTHKHTHTPTDTSRFVPRRPRRVKPTPPARAASYRRRPQVRRGGDRNRHATCDAMERLGSEVRRCGATKRSARARAAATTRART